MAKKTLDPYVFFSDGVALRDDTIVVAAGFTEDPEAATSRIYLKFGEEWLAHEVEHDFIVSVSHHDGVLFAVGRNGLVKHVGQAGVDLTADRVRGRFKTFMLTEATARGHLSRVRAVAGSFYACGWGGQIYRLGANNWTKVECGLDDKRDDDFLDIDGTAPNDLYVAGLNGAAAHFDGTRWRYLDLPTNAHIYGVKCLSADDVVLCGSDGVLLRGNHRAGFNLIDPGIDANFWSMTVFGGKLYMAYGDNGLYAYSQGVFSEVKIAKKNPLTHRLDATGNTLWSFGSGSIQCFDGQKWTEAVCPDNVP